MGVVAIIAPWNYPFRLAMIPRSPPWLPEMSCYRRRNCLSPGLIEKVFRKIGFPEDG